jgi:hypothetical protein
LKKKFALAEYENEGQWNEISLMRLKYWDLETAKEREIKTQLTSPV